VRELRAEDVSLQALTRRQMQEVSETVGWCCRSLPRAVKGGWLSVDGMWAARTAAPTRRWCCRSLLRADKGDQKQRGGWTRILLAGGLQWTCRGFETVPGNRGTLKILEDNAGSGSLRREVDYEVFVGPARVLSAARPEAWACKALRQARRARSAQRSERAAGRTQRVRESTVPGAVGTGSSRCGRAPRSRG